MQSSIVNPSKDATDQHAIDSVAGVCDGIQNKLRRFLQSYWLRPENAFWMTLRSETLAQHSFDHPNVDFACGDGLFSFLHGGGVLDPAFDVFETAGSLDRVKDEHADMFDVTNDHYQPTIIKAPQDILDVGIDLKPALLAKAETLGLYQKLVHHDCNDPLPFQDNSFQAIYCNAAYWVERIDPFLSELTRVLQPGGSMILQVKLDSMRDYTLETYRSVLGEPFLDIIGRGRHATWPALADRNTWEKRFAQAGLHIVNATPFITRTHAQLWDVGLRPLAPMLIKMANALTPETRQAIKKEWVDLFMELLTPFCKQDFHLGNTRNEPAEIQYVLTSR